MMSEEALAEVLKRNAKHIAKAAPEDHMASYYRWFWGEWGAGFEFAGEMGALGGMDAWVRDSVETYGDTGREEVMRATELLLLRLDQAGHFGTGAARETVLIYPALYDADPGWTRVAVERLNPTAAWETLGPGLCKGLAC